MLSSSCKEFSVKAQEIGQRRVTNRIVLQNHSQLLELLEIPQLMETCVRSSCYEEALELEAFSVKLKKNFPENSIIQDVVRISFKINITVI